MVSSVDPRILNSNPNTNSSPKEKHAWLVCHRVVVLGKAVRAHLMRKLACAGRTTRDQKHETRLESIRIAMLTKLPGE